jgi:hypothetical protein
MEKGDGRIVTEEEGSRGWRRIDEAPNTAIRP